MIVKLRDFDPNINLFLFFFLIQFVIETPCNRLIDNKCFLNAWTEFIKCFAVLFLFLSRSRSLISKTALKFGQINNKNCVENDLLLFEIFLAISGSTNWFAQAKFTNSFGIFHALIMEYEKKIGNCFGNFVLCCSFLTTHWQKENNKKIIILSPTKWLYSNIVLFVGVLFFILFYMANNEVARYKNARVLIDKIYEVYTHFGHPFS